MKTFIVYLRVFFIVLLFHATHGTSCPMFDPPRDGIITCVKTSSGKVCALVCKEGFDFSETPPLFYVCENGAWSFVTLAPADLSVKSSPECKAQSLPSKIKVLGLLKYFYTGDASNLASQVEIKKNFKALLHEPFSQSSFCKENSLCTDNNIEIFYDQDHVHCASYGGEPVGISDGRIANSSFTASSYYFNYPPWKARLNSSDSNAWYGKPWDLKSWIQVDLGTPTLVTSIATQGKRFTLYVKTYKLGFSDDGKTWTMYKESGTVKVFKGNSNPYFTVQRDLKHGVKARFFRIYPQTWNHGIALKFELYTCKKFT